MVENKINSPQISKIKSISIRSITYDQFIIRLITYSFIGWLIETGFIFSCHLHFSHRGLIKYGLPLIPLYGFAALILIWLLSPYRHQPVHLYLFSVILTTLIEYTTSLIDKHLFSRSTWNYDELPMSYKGIIALPVSLSWGMLASLVIIFFDPWLKKKMERVYTLPTTIIASIISIYALFCAFKVYFDGWI